MIVPPLGTASVGVTSILTVVTQPKDVGWESEGDAQIPSDGGGFCVAELAVEVDHLTKTDLRISVDFTWSSIPVEAAEGEAGGHERWWRWLGALGGACPRCR